MSPILFYFAGGILIILGAFFCRRVRPRSNDHGRRAHKSLGHFLILLALLPLALGYITQFYSSNETATDTSSDTSTKLNSKVTPDHKTVVETNPQEQERTPYAKLLQQAIVFLKEGQRDEAMNKANVAIKSNPSGWEGFFMRGNIYALSKRWDMAEKDYQAALHLDANNVQVSYNMADIDFMQKKYALARPGFLALEQDSEMGDLSTYKVFLCDLYGGHPDDATKELDALNQVGENASYYFANAAWSLYQHKLDDAQSWITSATKIYPPAKFNRYAFSLDVLGFPEVLEQHLLTMPDHSTSAAQ